MLCGVIAGQSVAANAELRAEAVQPGRGAGDHDCAAVAVVHHRRHRGLDGVVDAVEHHVDRIIKGGNGIPLFTDRGQDPRVREHEVDPAQLGHAGGHNGFQSLEIPNVALLGNDAAARLLDEVDGLVEVFAGRHRVGDAVDLTAEIEGDDVGALLGEPNRMRPPLATRGAGDERDFAIELACHDGLLSTTSRVSAVGPRIFAGNRLLEFAASYRYGRSLWPAGSLLESASADVSPATPPSVRHSASRSWVGWGRSSLRSGVSHSSTVWATQYAANSRIRNTSIQKVQ